MDFNWKRKSRLQEQLKFFGASKTRFISCYAKKPRVRVKLPSSSVKCTDSNRDYLIDQAKSALSSNFAALGGLGIGSQLANQQLSQGNMLAQAQLLNSMRIARENLMRVAGYTI